jgi:hypothetical protein
MDKFMIEAIEAVSWLNKIIYSNSGSVIHYIHLTTDGSGFTIQYLSEEMFDSSLDSDLEGKTIRQILIERVMEYHDDLARLVSDFKECSKDLIDKTES